MTEEVVTPEVEAEAPAPKPMTKAAEAKAFAAVADEARKEGKVVQVFDTFIRVDN